MDGRIQSHFDLDVFKKVFGAAMEMFEASRTFPSEEIYSLTDQLQRSARSVCANFAAEANLRGGIHQQD